MLSSAGSGARATAPETGLSALALRGDSSGNNSVRSFHGNITGLISRYNRLMSCLWGGGDGAKQGLHTARSTRNSSDRHTYTVSAAGIAVNAPTNRQRSKLSENFTPCRVVYERSLTPSPSWCRVWGHSRWWCGCCGPRRRASRSAGLSWPPSPAVAAGCRCWPWSRRWETASSGRSCRCCCPSSRACYMGDGRFKDSFKWRGKVGWKFLEIARLM